MENADERSLTRELATINTRELAFGTWTMNYLGEKTKAKKNMETTSVTGWLA